jgi:uncharacterized membrane protein
LTVETQRMRAPTPRTIPGRGRWWIEPVSIGVGFALFIIYSTWSVVFGSSPHHWEAGPYLSPYYSPLIRISRFPLSSAVLVAWVPLAFRGTCYYYRKAYFRAYFWDPPACAIAERTHRKYRGETRLPWVLNNLHRFFLYLALIVLAVLWFDTVNAFHYKNGFYMGLGSLLMLLNVALLTLYTFSCHALRHLVGGSVDCFSCVRAGNARRSGWRFVSFLNPHHGLFAWASLISVAAVDIYIRAASTMSCFGVHTGC